MEIKTNKWDVIKLRSFSTAKKFINKMKRQPSEWEKIIANEATDTGLISKIYKQHMQLNIRKTNYSIKKWAEDLTVISPKKTHRWPINTWKDAQYRSLLEKWKSKPQWGYHLTLFRMAVIKKYTDNKCGEDIEKREPACTVGNINWYSYYGKQYGDSFEN